MSLTVRVWWPHGRYDAATLNPAVPEWPPAPGRLFAALRASARTEQELDALRWLETQDSPLVVVDEEPLCRHRLEGYVVVNAVESSTGNLTHPGRTNGLRSRVGTHPADERALFVWPLADPDQAILEALDRLAREIPYLGRSTSAALVAVDRESKPDGPSWRPAGLGQGQQQLSVPYPGLTAELDDAHQTGARAWERYRLRDYAFGGGERDQEPVTVKAAPSSPYGVPLILRLASGFWIAGTDVGLVTTTLRAAVMSLVPDPLPPAVSGHGADGRPHVAFVGLPDVGHRHADGHLLAVAIIAPAGHREIADLLARACLGEDPDHPVLDRLRTGRLGGIALRYDPTAEFPRGARADRWIGPSRVWTTAVPLVLDQHARRSLSMEEVVADGVVRAGYPRPIGVELSTGPLLWGSQSFRPAKVPRRPGDRRLFRHARISFDEPVPGPLIVGALRHLGFGLCAPEETGGGRRK